MIIDLNYNDEDFKSKIINLEKGIKVINVDGDNIDVNKLCDILENIKENVLVNTKVDEKIKEEKQKVIDAGGLKIIGTERHESRRIDNQLRGRAGRQGDIGESKFYIGLDDDLMKIFGGDMITKIILEASHVNSVNDVNAVKVDLADDGTVTIYHMDKDIIDKTREMIENVAREVEIITMEST